MNDTPGQTNSTDATPLAQAIDQTSAEVCSRHDVGGGPAGENGNPGLGGPQGAGSIPNAGPAAADLALVKKTVESVMRAVDAGLTKRIYGAALNLSKDKEFAANIAAETALSDDELTLIGDLSMAVAAKYAFSARFAPEIGLGAVVISYGSRVYFAIRKLESLRAQSAKSSTIQP